MENQKKRQNTDLIKGRIVRSQSGFYTVETEKGIYTCRLRGRLKKGRKRGDIVAIGDWVQISLLSDKEGMIEEVLPRKSLLSRMAPTPRGEYQQIIIANPDQMVVVFACANPQPKLRMLDRFLVIAEAASIDSLIVFNKVDLVGLDEAEKSFGFYRDIGYNVLFTSVVDGRGIETLRSHLQGKVSAFAGPSGVGKSSLLNELEPGLGLAIREVSKATLKGKHTTVVRELFPLSGGGYIADTPGLKALGLWDIEPEEVDGYFPEIRSLVDQCQFSDCTHSHEPGCAVIQAVENGTIHPSRYESYLRIRFGDDE